MDGGVACGGKVGSALGHACLQHSVQAGERLVERLQPVFGFDAAVGDTDWAPALDAAVVDAVTGIVKSAAVHIGRSLEALYKLRARPGAEGFAAA
jgi:hypothetical protein